MSTIDPTLEGRVFTLAQTYLVGREKVREFAKALFAMDPLHHDVEAARAAGYSDVVAPPTFTAIVLAGLVKQLMVEIDSGLSLDTHVPIHTSESHAITHPMVADDEVNATLEVTSIKARGPATIINTLSTITTVDGAPRIEVTSQILFAERDGVDPPSGAVG